MTENKHNHNQTNMASMGIATVLSSMILAGFLLGYLTDYWLDTMPIFFITIWFNGFYWRFNTREKLDVIG